MVKNPFTKENTMKNKTNAVSDVKTGGDITAQKLVTRKNNPYWERLSQLYAFIMLAVFPLIVEIEGYGNTTYVKWIWFCVITCVYVAFSGFLFFNFTDSKIRKTRLSEGVSPMTVPQTFVAAYMVWGVISSLTSIYAINLWDKTGRYEGLASLLLYGAVFILVSFWGEFTEKYSYAVAAMAFILGVICIIQICGAPLYPIKDAATGERYNYWDTYFLGTIGNIDCLSGIGAMIVPFLAGSFIIFDGKWTWTFLPGMATVLYAMFFSKVNSGKLGLVAALVVMLPFVVDEMKRLVRTCIVGSIMTAVLAVNNLLKIKESGLKVNFGKTFIALSALALLFAVAAVVLANIKKEIRFNSVKVRKYVTIALVAVIVIALVVLFFYNGSDELLSEIHEALHGRLDDDAGSGRGRAWKVTFSLIGKKPIFGYGTGTFPTVFWPYNNDVGVFDLAHNDFLQIMLCTGILGLVLYLGFVVTLAVKAIKATAKCRLLVVLLGACAGYVVHSFFSFSLAIVTPLFWVFAGLLDHAIRQMPKDPDAKEFKWTNLFGSVKKLVGKTK